MGIVARIRAQRIPHFCLHHISAVAKESAVGVEHQVYIIIAPHHRVLLVPWENIPAKMNAMNALEDIMLVLKDRLSAPCALSLLLLVV